MLRTLYFLFIFLPPNLFAAGEIRIGVPLQPESLFYPIAADQVSDLITQLVVEPLLELDTKTNELTPVLAKKWVVTRNRVRFELNPLARFSDGSKITAESVQKTFEAFKTKQIPSPEFESQFTQVQEVLSTSDGTVQFTFKKASPDNLQRIVWLPILPETALGEFKTKKNFAKELAGSGPYLVESVLPGDKITLKKNPNYWNRQRATELHKYLFDKITVKIIPDYNAQVEMLKNGAIDYLHILSSKSWNTDLTGDLFSEKRLIKSQTVSKIPYQVVGIVWNMRLPLFQSVKVRTALAHLYPVKKFIKNFFYDSYLPASGIFHPDSNCHATENTPKDFNPDKASRLLQEEGWAKKEDGLLYKNGRPFQFELIVRQPASLRHLTLYQEELKKIGIEMKLVSLDWTVALNKVRTHDFEASEYSMDRPLLLSELKNYWGTKGGLNYSGISDNVTDKLLEKIEREFGETKRLQLCKELDKRIAKLMPLSFGWEQTYLRLAYSKNLLPSEVPVSPYSTWRNAFHYWDSK